MADGPDPSGTGDGVPDQLGLDRVLLLSLILPGVGFLIYELLHWSNPVDGAMCALLFLYPLFLLVWLQTQLPWTYIVFGLYRWRSWRRFRTAWALAPAIALALCAAAWHVVFPLTSRTMFRNLITDPMPKSLSKLKTFRSGGGLVAHDCLFYFEIAPQDFGIILASKPYMRTDLKLDDLPLFWTSSGGEPVRPGIESMVGADDGWPLPHDWGGVEVYQYIGKGEAQYTIVTDPEHRRVYLHADDYF